MLLRISLYVLLLFAIVPCALGQEEVNPARSLSKRTLDATLSSPVSSPSALQLVFEGTKDAGTVKANIGAQFGNAQVSLRLSGPIGAKAPSAKLAGLDGLANKATAEFGIGWVGWKPSANSDAQKEACASYLVDTGKAKDLTAAKKSMELAEGHQPTFTCSWKTLPAHSKYRDRFDEAVNWGTPLLFNARVKVGREEFEFTQSPFLKDEKASHTSYAATGSFGVLTNPLILLAVNYQYQSAYQAQDQSQLCSPFSGSTSLRCRDISIGEPDKKLRNIVEFESRKFFSAAAINPKIAWDIRNDVASIQVPIYFLQSKEGGLNGGVTLGWRSDTKAFTASVFVGEIFTLITKP